MPTTKAIVFQRKLPNPVETVQYIYPSIPAGAQNQTITYDRLCTGDDSNNWKNGKFICR